ncbi:MAG: T9SS type A sorting domain-containing protein [Bacteroidales bacterium]|nr:T9SS type A sorting domain-containing protein [Bacteroidales bacterium]
MKTNILLIAIIFGFLGSYAQNLNDLSFGTDSTFEVLTWNIEWFPKNGQTTVDYVYQIIENLDIDVIAIQEIDDTIMFQQMINSLHSIGYEGYYYSSYFAGLAYIYKTETVEINDIYEIYTTYPYWSPFPRSPMVMDLNYNGENIFVINNHLKCCGDGTLNTNDEDDEENRRYIAANLLKEYIDDNFHNKNVIVVGDMNDEITDPTYNNVFQNILNDTENYLFADMDIATGNSNNWSYPSWPSHLDHILITKELFDEFENESSEIQTIKIDDYLSGGFSTYDNNISDHRPVGIKFAPNYNTNINKLDNQNYFNSYPNPAKSIIYFQFTKLEENSKIEIYNIQGQKIISEDIINGTSTHLLNIEKLESGIYFAKLLSRNQQIGITKIIISK